MLPKAARPRHNLWPPVYTSGGTEGTLEITTAGAVSASGLSAPGLHLAGRDSLPVGFLTAAGGEPASPAPSAPGTRRTGTVMSACPVQYRMSPAGARAGRG